MTDPPAEADVAALVDEFVRRLAAGEAPDPDELVLAHPRHAAELEAQLHAAVQIYREVEALPRVGRYRLAAQIGAGASAVVYRAIDTAARRTVALKLFPPDPRTDRFDRDARLLARLKHPNIVQFLDAGVHDGRPYLVLELIEGGSLASRLAAGRRFTAPEAAGLVLKLAEALGYAHEQHVVHRDVKPGNVLIDAAGEPQLTDFGLGRELDGEPLTRSGDVLGTPLYMAPEQVRGDSRHADARTDVHALGAVLYELLAGRPPYEPTNPVELARRVAEDPPVPPRRLDPAVPGALETICLRCLEKDPADRFQTAAELAHELRLWLAGRSRAVWLPSPAGRARRWWRRQKGWVRRTLVAAAGLLAACGVLGWAAWAYRERAELHRREAAVAAEAAELAAARELQESQARARADVHAAVARGWRALQGGRAGRLAEVREALAVVGRSWPSLPPAERPAARFEARALFAMSLAAHDVEPDPAATVTLPTFALTTRAVAVHPAGGWLALGTRTRPLRLEPGTAAAPTAPDDRPSRLAFAPGGRFLACSPAAGGLQVWDGELRADRPLAELAAAGTPGAVALGFTPDGGELRACFADGAVRGWRTRDWVGHDVRRVPAEFGPPTAAAFTPAADRLAVGNAGGAVSVLATAGGPGAERRHSVARTAAEALAWAPDGRTLAAGFQEGRVLVWEADGDPRELSGRFPNGVQTLAYSPDGRVLCAGRVNTGSVFWDRAGKVLLTDGLVAHGFGPDGRTVTTGDARSVRVGRWVAPTVVRALRGHDTPAAKLACSADGRRLAAVAANFECRVWDVASGDPVAAFPLPAGGFNAANAGLAVSGDGRWVAYAGSGEKQGAATIRDLATGRDWGPWELPGGFAHLAAVGGDRFRLVREEFVGDSQALQSVLYDLDPARGPRRVAVVRPPRPTDSYRYFDGALSPDGRHYAWVGPREPGERARVEILDLESRRTLLSQELPQPLAGHPGLHWDAVRQGFLLIGSRITLFAVGGETGAGVREGVADFDEFDAGVAFRWTGRLRAGQIPLDGTPLVGLTASTFVPGDPAEGPFRFPGDRTIAWTDHTGVVLVADREALTRAVAEFERATFR